MTHCGLPPPERALVCPVWARWKQLQTSGSLEASMFPQTHVKRVKTQNSMRSHRCTFGILHLECGSKMLDPDLCRGSRPPQPNWWFFLKATSQPSKERERERQKKGEGNNKNKNKNKNNNKNNNKNKNKNITTARTRTTTRTRTSFICFLFIFSLSFPSSIKWKAIANFYHSEPLRQF